MSTKRTNSNIENKIKKNIMPITISSNINPNNYVFVNKNNKIASLYLKMGQKMQLKKHNNTKSCSNLQYSDESSKINNISNNSFQLSNLSMLKNLKTNNISGYRTNRVQNNDKKIPNKQDYIIHVNLNNNHTSSLSNYILNNKNNDNNSRFKYTKNNNKKSIISLNNSELYNSINCLSTRNKFYPKKKEDKSDLKKNKNNMKTKKFKFPFNERKKNKYISTSFCNLNINNNNRNINRTIQKSEDKILTNNLSQNRIISGINNEKKNHLRYNTMFIDEKDINEMIKKKNKTLKPKIYSNKTSIIKHNNSALSMNNNKNKKKLENTSFNIKNNQNSNNHIKNSLSSYGNKINVNNKLITKDKNDIKNNNKKSYNNKTHINIKKIKNNNNQIIERQVKINRKDLLKEIKMKMNNKKNNELKNKTKKIEKNKKSEKNDKIKEFSKIIVLDDYKYKKTSINFHNKTIKDNIIENLNKTKREVVPRCNLAMNNSKSKETIQIDKNKSFKTKQIKNKSIINNSLEEQKTNNFKNDNNKKDYNLIDNSSSLNNTYFPFPLFNPNKNNYKKPLIKITHNNISFNKNIYDKDKEPSNSSIINNSDLLSINQNNLKLKDKNFIIKKKKSIGNNSFHINKKLISNVITKNNNIIIINSLFDNENLEKLPENYDEKFNDLYAVVRKINFGSVLIGAESLFSLNSHVYKEFQNNFEMAFIKKYNKSNIDERKGKYVKKINNSFSTKTDFSSSNKNFYKNIYNNSGIPNEFEMSEII